MYSTSSPELIENCINQKDKLQTRGRMFLLIFLNFMAG